MQHNLRDLVPEHRRIVEEIRQMFPAESDENLADTIAGESNLPDAILATIRGAMEREDNAEAIGKRIETLKRRKDRLEAGAKSMRAMCLQAMQEAGLKKIAAPDFSLSVGQGKPKIIIVDESHIPSWLCKTVVTPSKTMIADEIAAGHDVPGAQLGNATPYLIVRTS